MVEAHTKYRRQLTGSWLGQQFYTWMVERFRIGMLMIQSIYISNLKITFVYFV